MNDFVYFYKIKMNISDVSDKKILYSALDWGFGHVTRSIGIIRKLLKKNNSVTIACTDSQKDLFQSYFPNIRFENLEGYNFQFSGNGNWSLDLWKQRKSFLENIKREHLFVNQYCSDNEVELIISDHRYGFFSEKIESIFLTHQLRLPINKLFFFVQKWHEKKMNNFNSIWVLDDKYSSLAGKLSKAIKHNDINYIGHFSRLEKNENVEIVYDYLIVISGPKPYSEQLFDEVLQKVDFNNSKVAVLHPKSIEICEKRENFTFFKAENLKDQDLLFHQSNCIISRSGYSTLMDVKVVQKESILFPTKGQKEQGYLSKIRH